MQLHGNARLTVKQRIEIKRLHKEEGISIRKLAKRYSVTPKTIQVWIHRESPEDHSSAPKTRCRVVTEPYKQAVLEYRRQNPGHGAIRIAKELSSVFPEAKRGTIYRILKAAKLICHREKKDDSIATFP